MYIKYLLNLLCRFLNCMLFLLILSISSYSINMCIFEDKPHFQRKGKLVYSILIFHTTRVFLLRLFLSIKINPTRKEQDINNFLVSLANDRKVREVLAKLLDFSFVLVCRFESPYRCIECMEECYGPETRAQFGLEQYDNIA